MNIECHETETALDQLYDEICQLIQYVSTHGRARLDRCTGLEKAQTLNKSVVNLSHYLALREIDLRPLQVKLAQAGLSSLGRAEPHVYANLKKVMDMLNLALNKPSQDEADFPYPHFGEGDEILEENAAIILGGARRTQMTRIMVTLPTEAATR